MRRYVLGWISAAVLLLVTAVLWLYSPTAESARAPGEYRVTCIIPSRTDTAYWQDIENSVYEAAGERDVDVTMLYSGTAGRLAMTQSDAIEIAILADTQAIITSYADGGGEVDEKLRQAREAGIYVVLIDGDGDSDLRDVFVGIDNSEAGQTLGGAAKAELAEGGAGPAASVRKPIRQPAPAAGRH